jgi:putative endonuclease
MFWVYVLQNQKNKKYTGSTSDLNDRLKMHNDISLEKAKFHRTTYGKGPWQIIFEKEFITRKDALEFERFLKTGKGRELLETT